MTELFLNKAPAFGFESENIRADNYLDATGERYHFTQELDNQYFSTPDIRNFQKVLGIIPVIGTAIGILRLMSLNEEMEEIKAKKDAGNSYQRTFRPSTTMARGVIETLSLGILLLIFVDLPMTCYRKIVQLNLP